MKKLLSHLVVASLLIPLHSALSQTLSDYVKAVKGDTLVIKDYYEMNNQPNSLYWAMRLDTVNVPEGRVYLLKANGYYPLANNPATKRNTIIAGEDNTALVTNRNARSRLPLICGASWAAGTNTGSIDFAHNLTVKNCCIVPGTSDGWLGWAFFSGTANHVRLTLQNCLLEQTRWVFMTTSQSTISWHIKDCYFVNMNDNYARRSGGVMDVFISQDTLLVENSTHVMAQGYVYRLRNYPFKRVIFNHNTFVNCANVIFQDYGFQSAMSVTNNIFVNCNVKPYIGIGRTIDPGEEDIDHLPVGIVNVYPDTTIHGDRKYLVDRNAVYWDPRLADIVDTLNAKHLDGSTNWVSQMITMNQRTQAMFNDNARYPYLTEGTWYRKAFSFTDTKDLLTSQVDTVKRYVIAVMDTGSGLCLPDWRFGSKNLIEPDWPIPVDLSYADADLQMAGLSGFPLGDLNWFPTRKPAWLAQRTSEYERIAGALNAGKLVAVEHDQSGFPLAFRLRQNYPNPFNPSTMISFSIPKAGYVTLKVYNVLGQEVATLLDDFKAPQTHVLKFDGTGLSSGVYIARLTAGGFSKSIKLVLTR